MGVPVQLLKQLSTTWISVQFLFMSIAAEPSNFTKHLQPIIAQNGSRLDLNGNQLMGASTSNCSLMRFSLNSLDQPWDPVSRTTLEERIGNGRLLTISRVDFYDGGMFRIKCPGHVIDNRTSVVNILAFLIVYDISCRQWNVSDADSTVEDGRVIRTTCEFKYSTGFEIFPTHWIQPIKWTSTKSYEDCTQESDNPVKVENAESVFIFTLCAKQTATPPGDVHIGCRLSYTGFRYAVANNDSSSFNSISLLWESPHRRVRYGARDIHIIPGDTHRVKGYGMTQTYICKADGYPEPTYRWRNVDDLDDDGHFGPELNVTIYDSGRGLTYRTASTYECIARNSQGKSSQRVTVPVTVILGVYAYMAAVAGMAGLLAINIAVCAAVKRCGRRKRPVTVAMTDLYGARNSRIAKEEINASTTDRRQYENVDLTQQPAADADDDDDDDDVSGATENTVKSSTSRRRRLPPLPPPDATSRNEDVLVGNEISVYERPPVKMTTPRDEDMSKSAVYDTINFT